MILLDTITTLIESFVCSYNTNYFCYGKVINKKKLVLCFFVLTILESYYFIENFDKQWIKCFLSLFLNFIVVSIIYRDRLRLALIPVSIISFLMTFVTIIGQNNFYNMLLDIFNSKRNYTYTVVAIHLVRWISCILQIVLVKYMCRFYEMILEEGKSAIIFLIVMNLGATGFGLSQNYLLGLKNENLRNSLTLIAFLVLIFALIYIMRESSQSRSIHKLNLELEHNNNELRKIKHDYGAQISYLYGLCLMNRHEDLKRSLKGIINNSRSSNDSAEEKSGSILKMALESNIKDNNIKVHVEERADLLKADMPEMDLYRVLSNIISNAVEAIKTQGNIFAKTYELEDEIIIIIQNDGPEIPEDKLLKIFNSGFTTKDNSKKSHGYGLDIVKELIEKSKGKISVKSSSELTEFRIILKISE